MKRLLLAIIAASALSARAIEDETDEMNWDLIGGSVSGFDHFLKYCEENASFKKKLLKLPELDPIDDLIETVWITPQAFAEDPENQWGMYGVQDEMVIGGMSGHWCGYTAIKVDVPADGYYRVWTRRYHNQGSCGAFQVSISYTDNDCPVKDTWSARYDFAELARWRNFLPNYKDYPTGWLWESSGTVLLRKGRIRIQLNGMVHDGPYDARNISAVVLTRDPFGEPVKPEGEGAVIYGEAKPRTDNQTALKLWARRPMISDESARHRPFWREWRKAFFKDCVEGKVEGVEAGRFAGMAYFDEEHNLIGTPKMINEEIARAEAMLKAVKPKCFYAKVEGEDFACPNGGWGGERNFDASGNEVLASYAGGEVEAHTDIELPKDGEYSVWIRYPEYKGSLANFAFRVLDTADKVLAERGISDDPDFNASCEGEKQWVELKATLKAGVNRFQVYSNNGGPNRKLDAIIVTNDQDYRPVEFGFVAQPPAKGVQVWRKENPWCGFGRFDAPAKGEGLEPVTVEVREGEAESMLVLVRNNTSKLAEITPEIKGDSGDIVQWRVGAFSYAFASGWQQAQLLQRDALFVSSGETGGIWLTIRGKKGFKPGEIKIDFGDETLKLKVEKKPDYPAGTPIPIVFGWSAPLGNLSSWEFYKDIGLNAINDTLVPKSFAEQYGIKLNIHLNDGDVSPEHIAALRKQHEDLGYDVNDWAWSFMDEPGESTADYWIDCAKKLREVDKDIKIWVNPGELYGGGAAAACARIAEYANIYCPYANHMWSQGAGNEDYRKALNREGPKFDYLLSYTTPCFMEKSPHSANELLYLADFAKQFKLDGIVFFGMSHCFTHVSSMWDDWNNYVPDQCMNVYPGARYRTISTRNAEAVREAAQRWRTNKAAE